MLKPLKIPLTEAFYYAAAFGRLCVETSPTALLISALMAAAFGRLCVETMTQTAQMQMAVAAAFGRLCVETRKNESFWWYC